MANYVKFRRTDKATYDGVVKDNNTIYYMPDDGLMALGTHIFQGEGSVESLEYNATTGEITLGRKNIADLVIDLPTEMIFDGEASYYDHATKELVMIFENSEGEVRIDFGDLAQKILDRVADLKSDLEDGTVVVQKSTIAVYDDNGQVIHETYHKEDDFDTWVETVYDVFVTETDGRIEALENMWVIDGGTFGEPIDITVDGGEF